MVWLFSLAVFLQIAALSSAWAQPLQSGTFTQVISSFAPAGGTCTGDDDDGCARELTSITVGGTTYTELTTPSAFAASGFPLASDVQSRIHNVIGDHVFGDTDYNSEMLANVFSNRDLNIYQQVDSNAASGMSVFTYPLTVPTTSDFFLVTTERRGNNTQIIEAFDQNGISLGTVTVAGGSNDYTDTGLDVGLDQTGFIAVIPMDSFADLGDPSREMKSFTLDYGNGNDGADHKTFVFGGVVAGASLSLVKDADDTTPVSGQTVTYTYEVTNNGLVDIQDVEVSDVHGGSGVLGDIEIASLTNTSTQSSDDGLDNIIDVLAPGDVATFTAEYIVTVADAAAGTVSNLATASGTPVSGTLNPATASETLTVSDPVANFVTDETDGNACIGVGGTLSATNLFTEFANGSLGFSADGAADSSPAVNPFGLNLTGATYTDYPNTSFGNWTVVSNLQNARNAFQHDGGIFDPVNGVAGRFFHIDPNATTAFPAVNLTGLTPGDEYEVSFWIADAEFTGETASVSIELDGTEVFNTGPVDNPTNTEMVWYKKSFNVVATNTTGSIVIRLRDQDGNEISNGKGRDIHMDEVAVRQCILEPTLTLDKEADVASAAPGETITYTYTVTNSGTVSIADVSVSDVHDGLGQLSDISFTGFADDTNGSTDAGGDAIVDQLEPGDIATFESTYIVSGFDVLAGATVTNVATADGTPSGGLLDPATDVSSPRVDDESVALSGAPRPALIPGTCGAFLGEGFLLDPGSPAAEQDADFGSAAAGPNPWDPYFTAPEIGRAANGVVNFYFGATDGTIGGDFSLASPVTFSNADDALTASDDGDLGHTSEIWRVAARVHGEPNTTEIITLSTDDAPEFTAYWITDVSGNVIGGNSGGDAGNDDGWLFTTPNVGGDGADVSISVTYPTNGVAIIQLAFMDPTLQMGDYAFNAYECPEPALDVAKSAVVGNLKADGTFDVTYSVVVENAGSATLDPLTLVDDLTASDQLDGAFGSVVSAPVVAAVSIGAGSTLPDANGGYDGGVSDGDLIDSSGALAPGDSYSVTFTVNVDPNDADAPATLQNTATATGLPPGGTPGSDEVSDESDTDTAPDGSADTTSNVGGGPGDPTVITAPTDSSALGLVKTFELADTDSSGGVSSGDVVTYTYVVTNTSATLDVYNVTVTEPNIAPNLFGGTGTVPTPVHDGASGSDLDGGDGTDTDIAVGETVTFTATYALTATDIANGGVTNSALASGTDPVGGTPTDTSDESSPADGNDDPTEIVIPLPGLSVIKSVSGYDDRNSNGVVDTGDRVTFSFTVANTGTTDLEDITIDDPMVNVSGGPIDLAEGQSNSTAFTARYTLDDDDIEAGEIENSATATGTVVDDSGDPFPDPFDPSEDQTVSDISDAGTDPDGNPVVGSETTETPGAGNSTDGDPTNDPTVFTVTPSPSIEVIKSIASINDADGNGLLNAGDRVTYSFAVTNTGNVDLADVEIDDPLFTVSGGPIDLDIGDSDTTTFSGTYRIRNADVNAGGIENTAVASGTAVDASGDEILDPISGDPLTAESDSDSGTAPLLDASGNPDPIASPETTEGAALDGTLDGDPTNDPTVLIIPNPELTLVKSVSVALDNNISGGDGLFGGEGDDIVYQFTVTNTGNVDLAGITVDDPLITITGGPIDLAAGVGDSVTFTGTYEVTAADITRGYIENSATAEGAAVDEDGDPITGPGGAALTAEDTSDTGTDRAAESVTDPAGTDSPDADGDVDGDPSNDATITSVPSNPAPTLDVIKSVASVADTTGDGAIGAGDTVTFSFVVTNTGNVRLGNVRVSDALATVSGGPITLEVGEDDTDTFTATHVITQAEADAGAVENTATATGGAINSDGNPIRDLDTGAQLVAEDTSDAGTEPEIDTSGTPTAYPDPLGNETLDAEGNGDGDLTNDPTVLFLPRPELTLTKSVASVDDANGNGFTDAGDTVTYSFSVENSGNTDITEITITDALVDVDGGPIDLAAGDSDTTTFTATYRLRGRDIRAGAVDNTATADGTAVGRDGDPLGDPTDPGQPLSVSDTSDAGTDPAGDPVTDPEGTETPDSDAAVDGDPTNDPTVFTVPATPILQLTKSVSAINDLDGDGLPGLGDEVVFGFVVENTGNVDLANVTIDDALGTVSGGPIDLAIGDRDTSSFTLTYALRQSDIDAGAVENTATVFGDAVDTDGDPIPDPVTGQPLTTFDTSDAGTQPEVGATGLPEDVSDPETTETPDSDGATDGDPANDPTVLVLPRPELTVVKSANTVLDSNNDGLFGGADDEVTYRFLVTNTGNVDLAGITLSDDLATVSGGPIDLAVGAGDSLSFTATYTVRPADVARGYLENTATAEGAAVNGDGDPLLDLDGDPITVSDISDAGTDPDQEPITDPGGTETVDGEDNTDGDPGNDPTVTTVPANPLPRLSIVKSVASVTDNGDGVLGAGDEVTYAFLVSNTGNVALADVRVSDPLVAVSGGPIDLAIGDVDSTSFTATYTLTDDDVTAGGVENTATATGDAVNRNGRPIRDPDTRDQLSATDTSDAGTTPEMGATGTPQTIGDPGGTESPDLDGATDTDPTNDPTVLFIPRPAITVIKSLSAAADTNGDGTFGGAGDVITYGFRVANTGNVDLADVVITDPTATVSGGPITLAAGAVDTVTFTATYMVTAADVDAGQVENSAVVQGTALGSDGVPLGNPADPGTPITVSDVSDTGTNSGGNSIDDPEGTETRDGDGNTDNDPTNDPTVTRIPVEPNPELELIKSVAAVEDTDGDAVLGGADDIVTYRFDVTNTGNTILSDVVVSDAMLGGQIGTIATLDVGETVTFALNYTITAEDQARGFIENTATAAGDAVNPDGSPLTDPDTGTPLTAEDDSDSGTARDTSPIDDPRGTDTPDSDGTSDGDPTNDPTVITIPVSVPDTGVSGIVFFDDDQDDVFDLGGDTLLEGVIVRLIDADGNVIAETTTDENGFYELTGFPIGTHDLEFVDPASGDVLGTIEGLVFERDTVLTDQNEAIIPVVNNTVLVLTKTSPLSTVLLGGTVPYVIEAQNPQLFPVVTDIVDTLPPGFVYLPDTATVNGVAVEPTVSVTGSILTWDDIDLPIGTTATIELIVRAGPDTPTGDLVNTATAIDPDSGTPLSVAATATVRRNVEAVFDCGDVIGKVFEDRNFDGYQNPPGGRAAGITNDRYQSGKYSAASPEGEPGLPRVRLVTPTGTIITTDEYGRYSVPCAELPREMGTNFALKLDERSLPTGYRVTTENPRIMRLTAGIMTEMNFGAALGQVIDLDLTAAAFDSDDKPVARLIEGINREIDRISGSPSVLRLSYFSNGEDRRVIKRRMDALEDHITARWRDRGDYRLIVERDIKFLQ